MSDDESQVAAEAFDWLTTDEDETVVWAGQPHLAGRANAFLTGLVTLPLLGFGLIFIVPAYLQIENTDFVLTTKRVYKRQGILSERIDELSLDRIQNTEYEQSMIERWLGFGTVGISTAGSSGTQIEFTAIEDARDVQDRIRQLRARNTDEESGSESDDGIAALREELRGTREAIEFIEETLRARAETNGGSTDDGSTGDNG